MKKILIKAVASILIFAIIIAGYFSGPMLSELFYAVIDFPNYRSVADFQERVESASKNISFKGFLIDLQSIMYRVTGVSTVNKDNEIINRLDNGQLYLKKTVPDGEQLGLIVDSFADFGDFVSQSGSEFLYCYAPSKNSFYQVQDAEYAIACEKYVQSLRKNGMNVLDLAAEMNKQGMTLEDSYFYTDHHWKIETGFWASGEILKRLNKDYGFEYDEKITDINNYNTDVYQDWFLGSIGKKVGRYFSPYGVDDISVITPKFETKLHLKDDSKDVCGNFNKTFIDLSTIDEQDYYSKNPYAVYGGDYPEQKIVNKLVKSEAKKLLVIRDSYACAVTPFLSLAFSELRVLDLRGSMHSTERVKSVEQYIKEYKPDYVIVLYNGIASEIDMYNFD